MSEIKIRAATPEDYPITEAVVREAFWNVYQPGGDEHYVLHLMRQWPSFLNELDFVALDGDRIVGSIVCNRSYIGGDDGRTYNTIGLGPIAVLPEYRGRGIGTRLIEKVRSSAGSMNVRAIVLFGDPEFYLKRGFRAAEEFNVRTEENYYAAALMLDPIGDVPSGVYLENSSYRINREQFALFDARFPIKEKIADTPSQLRYKEVSAMRRRARRG